MSIQLTRGAILDTCNNKTDGNPILQVIDVKQLAGGNNQGNKRFRLVISDGVHYQQAMVATQLNHMVESGEVSQFCIVRLDEFICNVVSSRRVVIILGMVVTSPGPGSQIGSPVIVDGAMNSQAASQSQPSNNSGGFGGGASQAPPSYMNNNNGGNRPAAASSARQFHPIASLNPYQNRWTIKARVTKKGDKRTWNNARGEGKLFSIDLLDSQGGEIKATMFNDAMDKFYDVFQENQVYIISRGTLKLANKRFSSLNNEYEITLNADAEVELVGEDTTIQTQRFEFVGIDRLQEIAADDTIDLICVVKGVSPLQEITSSRTGKELKKRTLQVIDNSLMGVDVTLWGEMAEKYNEDELTGNPVVAIKTLRVSDFGGRSLNSSWGSSIFVNMDIPEAHSLKNWWDTQGNSAQTQSISTAGGGSRGNDPRETFEAFKTKNLGMNEKPDYFAVKATVTFFKHDLDKPPWYMACPSGACNKKVIQDDTTGKWFCEKCNLPYDSAEPRFILSLLCCDGTGSQWLTAFNDAACKLLDGKTAQELLEYKETSNEQAFNKVFDGNNFKTYVFKCRAKADNNMEEQRVRCHVLEAWPMDYKKESLSLIEMIEKYD